MEGLVQFGSKSNTIELQAAGELNVTAAVQETWYY